jgi:hypothetical protein
MTRGVKNGEDSIFSKTKDGIFFNLQILAQVASTTWFLNFLSMAGVKKGEDAIFS